MKVKLTAEIIMNIPGEFQDDAQAIAIISDELKDRLDIGYEYEDDMSGEFVFKDVTIRSYFVTAGRIPS